MSGYDIDASIGFDRTIRDIPAVHLSKMRGFAVSCAMHVEGFSGDLSNHIQTLAAQIFSVASSEVLEAVIKILSLSRAKVYQAAFDSFYKAAIAFYSVLPNDSPVENRMNGYKASLLAEAAAIAARDFEREWQQRELSRFIG